jgi:hypothetical protein
MKNPLFFKLVASISYCILLFSCSQAKQDTLFSPEIKSGKVKISGKVMNYDWEDKTKKPVISLGVCYPVTAETANYETQLNDDGSFYFEEIPVECYTIGSLYSAIFNWASMCIADTSSPKKLWGKKIPGIGGEHYYLTGEEWKSISYSDKYSFDGIPTYLIFDKNGELKKKITAYPGNDAMRSMIEELL